MHQASDSLLTLDPVPFKALPEASAFSGDNAEANSAALPLSAFDGRERIFSLTLSLTCQVIHTVLSTSDRVRGGFAA
jgi:hypothetical protein